MPTDIHSFWLFHANWQEILVILCMGLAGGLLKDIAKIGKPTFKLWRREKDEIYLGTPGSMLTGLILAFIVDGHPVTSFVAAIGAPYFIESILDKVKNYRFNK